MKAKIKAKDFDAQFDKGEDVSRYLDRVKARRPAQEQKRVNVDFPLWMIHALDREARPLGVTRQSVIKMWLGEKLTNASAKVDLRSARRSRLPAAPPR